jgi:hypothetical protein
VRAPFGTALLSALPPIAPSLQLEGLILQGALMSPAGLVEAPPDAPLYNLMPTVWLAWIPADDPEPYPADRSVRLPVYMDTERERTCVLRARALARNARAPVRG